MTLKVALLGASGQLGTDVGHAIRAKNWHLIPLSRENIDLELPGSWWTWNSVPTFDVFINTAAFHKVESVESAPFRAFKVNAWAVRDLAEHCAKVDARFVHISTDYVFGDIYSNYISSAYSFPFDELDSPAPLNVYGASKLTGEGLALTTNERTTVVRVASLFGKAGSSGKGSNFVETMLRLAREGKPIKVVSDQVMSPTYTVDAANAIVRLIEVGADGLFHAAGTGATSWHGFAEAILRGTDADLSLCLTSDQPPSPVKRPAYSALDSTRLSRVTDYEMPTWEDGLARYLYARKD